MEASANRKRLFDSESLINYFLTAVSVYTTGPRISRVFALHFPFFHSLYESNLVPRAFSSDALTSLEENPYSSGWSRGTQIIFRDMIGG